MDHQRAPGSMGAVVVRYELTAIEARESPGLVWLPPVVPVALGLAAGGALAAWGGPPPLAALWLAGPPLALAAWLLRRQALCCMMAVGLLALLVGRAWAPQPPDPGAACLVTGEGVVDRVYFSGHSQGLRVHMDSGRLPPLPDCFATAAPVPPVRVGDRIRLHGLWSMEQWRGRWRPRLRIVELAVVQAREAGPLGWAWRGIDALPAHRDMAAALLLGRGRPANAVDFREAGLAHLLAVSGFHVGVVLVGLALLLGGLGSGWWTRQLAVVVVACAYLWLTGAAIPTQRAVLMSLALTAAGLLGRAVHPVAAVSLAAILLLLIEPADGQSVGFQLSLAAVLVFGVSGVVAGLPWRGPLSLWLYAVERDPENQVAHYNLARLLEQGGDVEAAIRHYRIALAGRPGGGYYHLQVAVDTVPRLVPLLT
ncbi:MAG: ComEC/Rec2 family competence protein, partial [Planctomycetota bacterium]